MSRAIEKRDMEVIRCDFCGDEMKSVDKCVLCGKEGCNKGGGAIHFAATVEIFNHDFMFRGKPGKICRECGAIKVKVGEEEISIREFLARISHLPCLN